MAKRIKEPKISISALERIAKEQGKDTELVTWNGIEVQIKHTLSVMEIIEFCESVADMCFSEEGVFIPQVRDFAIRSGVMTKYANFTLPDNIEKSYALVYATDAFWKVLKHIDQDQYNELIDAINCKIDYLCDSNINAIQYQLTKLIASFDEMQEQTKSMFGNLSEEDMQTLISAVETIGNGDVDESKIVNAYIDRMRRDEPKESPEALIKRVKEQLGKVAKPTEAPDNIIQMPIVEIADDDGDDEDDN